MKLINITGANATGKSTRVGCLVNFLDSKYESKLVHKNCRNGYKEIGRIYNDIFVLGRYNKSGIWVGLDLADYTTIQSRLDLYKEISEEYNVSMFIQEGYFNNGSKTLNTTVLKEYNVTNYSYYFLLYNNIQDFIDRCSGRTGQIKTLEWAENSAGWKTNNSILSIYNTYNDLNEENCKSILVDIHAPVDFFVQELFNETHEMSSSQDIIKEVIIDTSGDW